MPENSTLVNPIPATIDGFEYRCQWDPRWADMPYSVSANPEQTVGKTGCVPTLQTVALRNLCDLPVEMPDLMAWNIENGMRTEANGTKRVSWNLLTLQTGLRQEAVANDVLAVQEALALGGLIIVSLKAPHRDGLGTPSGHVVALRSIDAAGGVRAIDVNNPDKSQQVWPAAEVFPYVSSALRHLRRPLGSSAVGLRHAPAHQRLRAHTMLRG